MAASPWNPSPPRLAETRSALHTVAEHVLAAYRFRRRPHRPPAGAGGIGTLTDGRWVGVVGGDLVVREETGAVTREPVTTLRSAGTLVGIPAGLPPGSYTPVTPLDLDAGLEIDPGTAAALAAWFALVADALGVFVSHHRDEPATDPTIWPEHFDLALSMGEVNYGGSPGDGDHPEPYLYVSPWTKPSGDFWNEPFGASRTAASVPDVAAAGPSSATATSGPRTRPEPGQRRDSASTTKTMMRMSTTFRRLYMPAELPG
jgi:hypothetical protein